MVPSLECLSQSARLYQLLSVSLVELVLHTDFGSAFCHTSQRLESQTPHGKLVPEQCARAKSAESCRLVGVYSVRQWELVSFLESFQRSVPLTAAVFPRRGNGNDTLLSTTEQRQDNMLRLVGTAAVRADHRERPQTMVCIKRALRYSRERLETEYMLLAFV